MFDTLTTAELRAHLDHAYDEHTRRWDRSRAMPVTHPDYPMIAAGMYEIGEHLRAIITEITRRDQETAHA